MTKLKIGVLGTGDVGRVLGAGLAALGHEVKIGSRDAKNPKAVEWAEKTGSHASAGTFARIQRMMETIGVMPVPPATNPHAWPSRPPNDLRHSARS